VRRIDKKVEDSKSYIGVKAKIGWRTNPKKNNTASNGGTVKRMATEVEGRSIKERNNST